MGNGMAYSFKVTGSMDRDGMMLLMDDMGFSRIRDSGSGLSAELYAERDGCEECMSDHCAAPVADRIRGSEYAKDVKVEYSETWLSSSTYKAWIALFNAFSPEYRKHSKEIKEMWREAEEKARIEGQTQ